MQKESKVLSIVIPCYNEEKSIVSTVKRVLAFPIEKKEIIIVDDCSTDDTGEVLEREGRHLKNRFPGGHGRRCDHPGRGSGV